jgi:hypothetical protein
MGLKVPGICTILETSDWHLGHVKTSTKHILTSIKALFTVEKLAEVDLILLGGDIFDRELHFPDDQVNAIQLWMADFLTTCASTKTIVRIVEGTPSHDRRQSKHFLHLNKLLNINADIKYFDDISIEYIKPLDLHILYVPDEIRGSAQLIYESVIEVMETHGLTTVDYALMHGNFEYQLPSHVTKTAHSAEAYLKLVTRFIFIGHIHRASRHQRILAAGSIDRVAHGEEHPKGYWIVNADCTNSRHDKVRFHHNANAMTYITINITEYAFDDIPNAFQNIHKLKPGEHIRVQCAPDEKVRALIQSFRKGFPLLNWDVQYISSKRETERLALPKAYNQTVINKNTLLPLLRDKIKGGVDVEIEERVIKLLSAIIHNDS